MKKIVLIIFIACLALAIGIAFIVHKVEGASSANYAGTAADNGGLNVWVNTSNATGAFDDSGATSAVAGAGQTNYLNLTNFGFAIPAGATINGVAAAVRWTTPSGEETGSDFSVKLIVGGTITGTDQATSQFIPIDPTDSPFGNSTNTWGLSLTPTDINASNFGIALKANNESAGLTVDVDGVQLTIYYTAAAGQSGTVMMMATDF